MLELSLSLSGTRCCVIHLLGFLPGPGIIHFSKSSWFLLMGFSNHNTSMRSAHCHPVVVSSPFQRQGQEMCVCLCVHVRGYIHTAADKSSPSLEGIPVPCPPPLYISIPCPPQLEPWFPQTSIYLLIGSEIDFVRYTKATYQVKFNVSL